MWLLFNDQKDTSIASDSIYLVAKGMVCFETEACHFIEIFFLKEAGSVRLGYASAELRDADYAMVRRVLEESNADSNKGTK